MLARDFFLFGGLYSVLVNAHFNAHITSHLTFKLSLESFFPCFHQFLIISLLDMMKCFSPGLSFPQSWNQPSFQEVLDPSHR